MSRPSRALPMLVLFIVVGRYVMQGIAFSGTRE